jgi:hypothetical protein
MTNDEWLETPAADAITNFLAVMMGTLASAMGGVIGGFFTKLGSSFLMFLADKEQTEDKERQPSDKLTEKLRAHLDPDREDPRRNGLTIVAAWSAFESSFDDFAKALIIEWPEALMDKDISKIKVPITQLFADGEEKAEVVLDGLKDTVGKTSGVSRCEAILKYLGLNGTVPQEISAEIYHSQMIRHVWAHRAGIADTQFVGKTKKLGLSEGDLVAVDAAQLATYLTAILMYALIIMNRHRERHGLGPKTNLFKPEEGKENALSKAFHGLYATEDSERDTSPSESDAPPALPAPPSEEAPPTQSSSTDSTPDAIP